MATDPQFVATPSTTLDLTNTRSSTANTNRDGTGTINYIVKGGANGTRLERVIITATGTTTAGMIRFFIQDAAAHIRLVFEVPVTAITPSGTIQAFSYEWVRSDGQPIASLPKNWQLGWAPNNAEQFDVVPILAGDY